MLHGSTGRASDRSFVPVLSILVTEYVWVRFRLVYLLSAAPSLFTTIGAVLYM